MRKKEEKSSWDELAKLLGTDETSDTTPPPTQPESPSIGPIPPRVLARPVRPRPSDWNVLASELGLTLPDAPPPKSEKIGPSETSFEAQTLADEPAEAPRPSPYLMNQAPWESAMTGPIPTAASASLPGETKAAVQEQSALVPLDEKEPAWSHFPTDFPTELDEPDGSEPGPIIPEGSDAATLRDPTAPVPVSTPKESRRRRRGGRRRNPASKHTSTASKHALDAKDAETAADAPDKFKKVTGHPTKAGKREKMGEGHPEEIPAMSSNRKKRRRRGGSDQKPRKKETSDDSSAHDMIQMAKETPALPRLEPRDPMIDAETSHERHDTADANRTHHRGPHRSKSEPRPTHPLYRDPLRSDQSVSEQDPEQTQDEFEDDLFPLEEESSPADIHHKPSGKRSSHQNIPTWDETVGILIDNNLSTRSSRQWSQRSGAKNARRGHKR